MMRFLLILTAIAALVWFGLSQLPLGFALRRLPLNTMGVQWTQSEGTVWNGRIMGVYLNGQPIGDVDVALKPFSLLAFKPEVDMQWGGAGSRGAGTLVLDGGAVEGRDLRLEQQVAALQNIATELRSIGGVFRLSDAAVRIEDGRCESATGQLRSNTLSLAAERFGRDFPALEGAISCENGAFQMNMEGRSKQGDMINIDGHAALYGPSDVEVAVTTSDKDVEAYLASSGFSREDGVWTYRKSSVAGGQGTP